MQVSKNEDSNERSNLIFGRFWPKPRVRRVPLLPRFDSPVEEFENCLFLNARRTRGWRRLILQVLLQN
jgi:hypothetical protein